jgi:hypothetical protein
MNQDRDWMIRQIQMNKPIPRMLRIRGGAMSSRLPGRFSKPIGIMPTAPLQPVMSLQSGFGHKKRGGKSLLSF